MTCLYAIVPNMAATSKIISDRKLGTDSDQRVVREVEIEADALNRKIVTIPAEDWESFGAWLDRPADPNPALQRLMALTPSWER